MSSLLDILNTVNNALADDSGFDLSELDKAVAEMHLKLTEPEWAIEDEALREECQKLVVQWAAQRYLDGVTDLELDKPLADTDVANPPTPTDTNTSFKEELEKLEVEFLHGVPVKLPPATITSIINLVDKEVAEYQRLYIDAVEIGLKGVGLSLNEKEWLDLIAVLRESQKTAQRVCR
jgi:hypothetical protein